MRAVTLLAFAMSAAGVISAGVIPSAQSQTGDSGPVQPQVLLARLPAATRAVIDQFATTLTAPVQFVEARIPAVGCPQDGQIGPLEALALPKDVSVIVPAGTNSLVAFYSTHEKLGSGVLAPRGWKCFGRYGSDGETLYVAPRSPERLDRVRDGPAVILSVALGDTSGRFTVAKISARVFPRARRFVDRVREERLEQTNDYVFAPWPTDRIHRLSEFMLSYVTPRGTQGLGTSFGLAAGSEPIFGLAFLTGDLDAPTLERLAIRLPKADKPIYPAIAIAKIASADLNIFEPPISSKPIATQAQTGRPITEAFIECLLSQGQNGSYTSFDGGKSAIKLMGEACKSQWDAWQDQCIAQGGTDGGPNGCTMQAGVLAQSALKLLGK